MVETTEKTLTRKKLLKRAGAGTAALWALPALTSVAHASHGGRHTCGKGFQCGGDPCSGQTACRPPDPVGGCGIGCFCAQTQGGRCHCYDNDYCSNRKLKNGTVGPCATNADCPAGQRCLNTCCGVPLCWDDCGVVSSDCTPGAAALGGSRKGHE
jgi:hypothetical protein